MIVEVWNYTARGGKFTVNKCTTSSYMVVDGKVDPHGPSVCLYERDDELARRLFIAYEE